MGSHSARVNRFVTKPFGPWLLILISVGLMAFGVLSFLEAKHRRTYGGMPVPSRIPAAPENSATTSATVPGPSLSSERGNRRHGGFDLSVRVERVW
ncbi:DUF1206 domain-containing protein [Nocardia sp. NPDC046473]|uniref:DUF1206 domain-containing protein n=1 Tax=Nocardia sp. NPDC046473 TaxID=3155733 RepID=UPI0033C78761